MVFVILINVKHFTSSRFSPGLKLVCFHKYGTLCPVVYISNPTTRVIVNLRYGFPHKAYNGCVRITFGLSHQTMDFDINRKSIFFSSLCKVLGQFDVVFRTNSTWTTQFKTQMCCQMIVSVQLHYTVQCKIATTLDLLYFATSMVFNNMLRFTCLITTFHSP